MSWTYLLWDGKTYACPPCEWLLLWPTYTFPLRHRLMLLLLHLASWFGLKQCSDNEQRCDSAHLHLQVRRCLCSPLTFCFSPSLPVFFFGLLNCLVSVSVNCSPSLCLSYKHVVATFSGAALQASGFAAAAGLRSYAQAYQASSPTHQSRRRAMLCVASPAKLSYYTYHEQQKLLSAGRTLSREFWYSPNMAGLQSQARHAANVSGVRATIMSGDPQTQ